MSKQTELKKISLDKVGLDTKTAGGTAEQITMLSARIDNLTKHLKINRKDLHSTRGLLQMIANRRKLIKYFKRRNMEGWKKLADTLGLKK